MWTQSINSASSQTPVLILGCNQGQSAAENASYQKFCGVKGEAAQLLGRPHAKIAGILITPFTTQNFLAEDGISPYFAAVSILPRPGQRLSDNDVAVNRIRHDLAALLQHHDIEGQLFIGVQRERELPPHLDLDGEKFLTPQALKEAQDFIEHSLTPGERQHER